MSAKHILDEVERVTNEVEDTVSFLDNNINEQGE